MWSSWSETAKKMATAVDGAVAQVVPQAKKEETTTQGESKPAEEGETKTEDESKVASEGSEKKEDTTNKGPTDIFKNFQTGWSSVVENTQQSIKTAQSKMMIPNKADGGKYLPASGNADGDATGEKNAQGENELFKNFQTGWSSVMEHTKQGIKNAQSAVEAEQQKLAKQLQRARTAMQKRDPKLPLDVPALRDAQVVYITDRLITLSHPAMASSQDGEITAERKLAAVAHLLHRRHDGRFMIWNLSEVDYDTGFFEDQVLNFSFPGSPSPPLGLMLKLLVSMESWLKADERNVAVVHCLTGKGRTSMVLSAFLCWMGEAGFGDIYQALDYIAKCKKITPEELTIPSQRRYASYFKNMLDGVRPSQPPVMLKRVTMSVAPKYAKGPARESDNDKIDDMDLMGCAPYLQLFKGGNLVHTAPASLHFQQSAEELPFCRISDGQISFQINQVVHGDILLRCRHLTARKQRVSMFRAAFHTGYAPPNVMRMNKSYLDGACTDDRFADDFYIDVIFEPVDAAEASEALKREDEETHEGEHAPVEVHDSKEAQALAGGGVTVRASSYDVMLHRDSRFWDVIAKRNEAHAKGEAASQDPTFGPTIGRRREFGSGKSPETSGTTDSPSLQTFSIGNEFDFLPSDDPKPALKPTPKPKKDSLMEALMGALNDDVDDEHETEVIVFDSGDGDEMQKSNSAPPSLGVPSAVASAPPANQGQPETSKNDDAEPGNHAEAKSEDDMEALLADDMNFDGDMDALLAGVGEDGDLDMDADLEDFENFLSKS